MSQFKPFITISLICLHLWIVFAALAQEEGTYTITSPTEGQPLFGLVEILGSATHPTLFESYALEWSNAQNPDIWLPIQQPIAQQVSNGILGQWDTVLNGIPDGVYQIRLRVFLTDGSARDVQVSGLVLANSTPTSIPTTLPTANSIPLDTGATQPSIILQPPTATARPTFESPQTVEPLTTETNESTLINFGAIQTAFCNGVLFTMGLFGVVIVYLLVRQQVSPYTRRIWWQIRSELDNSDRGE